MFVIIYEDHGQPNKIIATATTAEKAKSYLFEERGIPLEDWETETIWEGDNRIINVLGDAQYAIEGHIHVS